MPEPAKRSILRRTIRISNAEGVFSQVYNAAAGPGSIFNTKFAILLGAQPIHFGLLVAIGQLSQVFQLLGVAITRNLTTRKEVVVKLISAGRILTFLMGFIPFILPPPASMLAFLLLLFASSALQAIGSNAWVAWISDIVPNCMRGRFFSIRTQYLFIAGLAAGFLLSAFVDLFDPSATTLARLALPFLSTMAFFSPQNLVYAFPIVFIIGGVLGLVAMRILARQPEKPKAMERETFRELVLTPLKDANFRRLLLFGLWFMVAVGVGSPFWQPFMIQSLGHVAGGHANLRHHQHPGGDPHAALLGQDDRPCGEPHRHGVCPGIGGNKPADMGVCHPRCALVRLLRGVHLGDNVVGRGGDSDQLRAGDCAGGEAAGLFRDAGRHQRAGHHVHQHVVGRVVAAARCRCWGLTWGRSRWSSPSPASCAGPV